MYLVLMLQHNRATYAKVFDTFDAASDHADDLVMMLSGVSNEMPDWEGGEVYEHDGYGSETVMVTGCHVAPSKGENIKPADWYVNSKVDFNNKYDKWRK